MKKTQPSNPTTQQFEALTKAYEYFNTALFFDKLPPCILTTAYAKNALGFAISNQWRTQEKNGKRMHEIALTYHAFSYEAIGFYSTLVHEMVHIWQFEFGKTGKWGYHNKEWGQKMKEVGLIPSHTGREGGEETGEKMSHYIEIGGRFEQAFQAMPNECFLPFTAHKGGKLNQTTKGKAKVNEQKGEHLPTKRNRNKTPYICTNCQTRAWGKPNLNIKCGTCDKRLSLFVKK